MVEAWLARTDDTSRVRDIQDIRSGAAGSSEIMWRLALAMDGFTVQWNLDPRPMTAVQATITGYKVQWKSRVEEYFNYTTLKSTRHSDEPDDASPTYTIENLKNGTEYMTCTSSR